MDPKQTLIAIELKIIYGDGPAEKLGLIKTVSLLLIELSAFLIALLGSVIPQTINVKFHVFQGL